MTSILIFLGVWTLVILAIFHLVGRHLGRRPRPHSSLAAELPATRAAAEGEGAHPVSAGHSASPSAEAPPPGVSRLEPIPPHLHRWWANGVRKCTVCGEWLSAEGGVISAPGVRQKIPSIPVSSTPGIEAAPPPRRRQIR